MAKVSGKMEESGILTDLGRAIRSHRLQAGLSQEALADAAGIDRSHMGEIERGERNVSLVNVEKVANALELKLSSLIAMSDH